MGRLAKWWAGKSSLATTDGRRAGCVVESLEPRLLLSAAFGSEEADPIRIDVNPTASVIPVAAIEVSTDTSDCATDAQLDSLQLFLTQNATDETQAGNGGSDSTIVDSQPAEAGIETDPLLSTDLSGEISSQYNSGSLAASYSDAAYEGAPLSHVVDDGLCDLQSPVTYEDLPSSTEQLVDTLHVPNPPPQDANYLTVTASGMINVWDFQPQLLAESGVCGLIIQGTDETDDTLVVDLSRGDLPLPVTFHGGAGGYDTLVILGMVAGTYTPGQVFGDGTIQAGATSISFTGLEPIVIDGAVATGTGPTGLDTSALPSTLTFTTPGGVDVITIDSPAAGQNRISGTSGGVTFESITFTNVQTVVIDTGTHDVAGSDADSITIVSGLVATGLANLTITTGTGDDVLRIQTTDNPTLPVAGGVLSFDGGEGSDRIEGPAADITWNLTGSGAGNLGGTTGLVFTNVESLVGGSGQDTFAFPAGVSFEGTVDGLGGSDTLDYSAWTDPVVVNLAMGSATGTGGVSNVEDVIGGSGADEMNGNSSANILVGNAGNDTLTGGGGGDILAGGAGDDTYCVDHGGTGAIVEYIHEGIDTINGPDAGANWVISGADTGTVGGMNFANAEHLVGGVGDDNFAFEGGGSVSGSIEGGSGSNDTVTGAPVVDNTWTVTGTNAGTLTFNEHESHFTGIEHLAGRADNIDAFIIKAGGSVVGVDGGTGGTDGLLVSGVIVEVGTSDGGGSYGGVTYAKLDPQPFVDASDPQNPVITGSTFDDTIRVYADGAGLNIQRGSTIYPISIVQLAVLESLTIEGRKGSDTITIESLPDGFSADLQIYGRRSITGIAKIDLVIDSLLDSLKDLVGDDDVDSVVFAGSISSHGGDIGVIADTITVKTNAVVSTSMTDGNSGDIDLGARTITLEAGSGLLADAAVGYTAGDVTLEAWASSIVRWAGTPRPSATITATGTTIKGDWVGMNAYAQDCFGVFGWKKDAVAHVTLTDTVIIANAVSMEAGADTSLIPPVEAEMTGNPNLTFGHNAIGWGTITRDSGSWLVDGFFTGQAITVYGTENNDGYYTVAVATPDTITLIWDDTIVDEASVAGAQVIGQLLVPDPETIISEFIPFPNPMLFSLSNAEAKVQVLGASSITAATGSVRLSSSAESPASSSFPGVPIPKVAGLAAVWTQSSATAVTSIDGTTSVTAHGALELDASASNSVTGNAMSQGKNKPVSVTFAGSKADTIAKAYLGPGTTVITRDLSVSAEGSTDVETAGAVINTGASGVSMALALTLIDTDTDAWIAGTVHASGDVSISAAAEESNITQSESRCLGSTGDIFTQLSNQYNQFFRDKLTIFTDFTKGFPVFNPLEEAVGLIFPVIKSGKFNLAGGVTFAKVDNDVHAFIADNAHVYANVDAGGAIEITASMVYRSFTTAVSQSTSDGVAVGGAVAITIDDNDVKAYIGKNAVVNAKGPIDITATFLTPFPWETDFTSPDAVLDFLMTILGGDVIQLILSSYVFNSSTGSKFGLAASVDVRVINNLAEAYIDEGADVDSGASVTVYARNEVNGLHLTGQMAGWSFLDQLLTNQVANKLGSSAMLERINDLIFESGIWNKSISVKALDDPKAGVGGAINFVYTKNKAIARIADGATVTAAADVNVLADTQERLITVAASEGSSAKIAVYGSGDIVLQNSTALAYIEDRADITAGDDLTVRATNDPRVYSFSGGVVMGAQVGIGISMSFNQVTVITKAFIGNGATISGTPGLTFTNVSLTGNPSLRFEHVAMTGTDTLTFADNALSEDDQRDTITRSDGSWVDDGFQAGQYITIEGSAENDGTYRIAEVTDSTLILDEGEALAGETLTRHAMSGSLTFADNGAAADTITRGSGSWTDDGFAAGQMIRVEGSGDNDGLYLIAGVTASTLTLVASDSLHSGTASSASVATVSLTAPDTITRDSGSWLDDGFLVGQTITVGGTSANNGTYTIQTVTDTCITLQPDEALNDETVDNGATVSAADTIIRDSGSWLADGFQPGQTITVSDAGADNDGTYTIGYVTEQVLTLIPTDTLTDGTSTTAMVTNDPEAATGVISVADDIDIQAFSGPQIFSFSLAGYVALSQNQAPASGDSTAGAPTTAKDAAGNTGGFGLGISGDASVNYVNMTTLAYIDGAVSVKAHDVHLVALTSSSPRLTDDPSPDFGIVAMTGAGTLTFADNASSQTDTRDTITRDSGSWVTDGFRAGQKITIEGSVGNDGTYTIAEVTASTLTLAQDAVLTNETLTRHVMSGSPVLTFADNGAAADTITRDSGSWLTDGFEAGQTIYVQGSDGNDGTYTIAEVTDSTLTLSAGDVLTAGTASGMSVATPAVTAPNTFGTQSPTTEQTLTFTDNGAAADTIARSSGDWIAEGFRAGQSIKVSGTTSNNGTYIIADATPTTLTLTSNATLTNEITDSSDDPSIEAGAAMTGNPALTFTALPLAQDTIERSEGSWIADGFRPGMKIKVSGTQENNGEYTLADVSATTLTLTGILIGDQLITLQDEGPITGVVITATDRGKAAQIFALAGAVTITRRQGSGAAIAGSFTMNQINARTEAFLAHTEAQIGRQLVLGAHTPAAIYSIGASVSVATDKGKISLAGQVTYNKIDNESRAYITDTVVSGPEASTQVPLVALVAEDAAEIVSVAGAVAYGGKAGIGASVAINTVSNTTESFILNSNVTAASVSAQADSKTEIIAVTAAVGASSGKMAAEAAVSVNMVSNTTAAFIKSDDDTEHGITASGPIGLNAVDASSIYAIAGGIAFAKGKVGIGVSVTYNEIDNETLAYISDMTVTSTAGGIEIGALSKPLIFSIAVAGAVAVSSGDGTSVAVAIGGTLAMNEIADTVLAYVDASGITANGDLVVDADSDADIETLGIGVSVSVASGSNAISVSIGVCVSWNIIDSTVEAYLNDSDVTSSAGNIALTADSDNTIRSASVAASLAIAVFSGSGLAISGAGALASNSISGDTNAYINGGTVTAKDLTLAADNGSRIDALVLAAAVGAGALGAAVALNTISGEDQDGREAFPVRAYAQDAVLNVGGDLSLTATSTANIGAAVNAAAVGVVAASSDSTSLAASGAGVYTSNEIAMDVMAFITAGSVTLSGGDLTLSSTNASEIKAEAGAASVALAFGSTNSFSLSIGVALAHNRIDDRVEAFLDNLSSVLTDEGNISISAEDESTIRATAVAVAVSASMGGSNGVALSGGGAEATNIILTTTNAYISDSTVGTSGQQVGDVDLDAKSTADIDATIVAVAASVSYGGTTGVGVALGVAVARNFIGWDITDASGDYETSDGLPQGQTLSNAQTKGTPLGTTVKISDGARAGDVYEYLGPTLTQPVQTGTSSDTKALTKNEDFILVADDYKGSGTLGAIYKYIGESTGATAVDLSQEDYTDTDRWQLVSIDLRILDYSDRSLWKQVNVDDSQPNEVRAYLENTSVQASGALTLDAQSSQSITAKVGSGAAALSGGGTAGIAASGAGVYAENRINSVVQAYIDGDGANTDTDGISAASVHIAASDASGINAVAGAASLAASVGGTGGGAVSIGLSIAINEVRNDVEAYISDADGGVTTSSGSITISAVSQGQYLFDLTLSGLITAANLDDAATADADNPDDPASETDSVTSRFDDAVNEAVQDADDDRAILEALRTAFGETLALYDTVATAAKYRSSDDEQDVREGDTVLLAKDYANGGLGGRVYRYIVKAPENSGTYGTYGSETYQTPNNIDLSAEDYRNIDEWQLVEELKLSILVEGKSWLLLAPDGQTYVLELITKDGTNLISVSHTTISAVSAAASLAIGIGGSGGVAVSGAGAVAQNVILTKTNAYAQDSVLDSYDDVTISAASTSTISSTVVAASLAIGGGGAAGVGASIGVSIARNFIGWTPDGTETPAQVQAHLSNTSVKALGDLTLTSLASQRVDSVVFAGSAAVALGGTVGVAASGSGVWAENKIGVDVKSCIDGDGDGGIVADSVTLTADDTSTIKALAGAASLAASVGGTVGVSFSIGVSLARNTITGDVEAYILNADGLAAAEDDPDTLTDFGIDATGSDGITIRATESAAINAISTAASLAAGFAGVAGVAISGAGADANNIILTGTNAYIQDSAVRSAGEVDLDASNTASIRAVVVSASAAIAVGGIAGVGASLGVAVARNYIGWNPNYLYAADYATGSNPPSIVTGNTVKITAGANAGNVYEYIGTQTLFRPTAVGSGNGQGNANENNNWLTRLNYADNSQWRLVSLAPDAAQIQAYILDSNVGATGALTLDAISNQTIDATVFAGSVAISGGLVGVSLSGAGAGSENRIATLVQAYIQGDKDGKGITAASVSLNADDTSAINAFTGAASIGAAFGGGGVSLSIGVGIAFNEIDNDVAGFIKDVDAGVTSTSTDVTGDISITVSEDADIEATAAAASAAVALGLVGASLSGAGAVADNVILGSANAYVDNSVLRSAQDVLLDADNTSTINAEVLAVAAAIGGGAFVGAGLSIGAAIARNRIGYSATGVYSPIEVQAYIKNSSADVAGDLTLTATSTADIDAIIWAGSVAASAGGFAGIGASGAGTSAINRVAANVKACIDGSGTMDIIADSISLTAGDASTIDATVGTAAVAIGVGLVGAGISVGVSIASNEVDNQVSAYIANSQNVQTRDGGAITISATENATINALGVAASAALGAGLVGVSVAGAGVDVTNVILNKTNAYIENAVVGTESAKVGNVTITATDTSLIDAEVGGLSVAASGGFVAVGVAVGVALAKNLIGWTQDGTSDPAEVQAYVKNSSIHALGDLSLAADANLTIEAMVLAGSLALGGGVVAITGAGAGVSSRNRIRTLIKAFIDGTGTTGITADSVSLWADDNSSITAVTGSASLAGAVGLISVSISVSVGLAENEIASEVDAYVKNAGLLKATGTDGIEIEVVDAATISCTATAASAAVGAGWLDGIAIAGGGAEARNVILTKTRAYADGSALISAATIDLTADDTSTILARVTTEVASVASGGVAGALAIGAVTAHNFIGYKADGTAQAAEVLAYLQDSTVDAEDAVTLRATENATITADIRATVASAAGGQIAVAAAGAGILIENKINTSVKAFVADTASNTIATLVDAAGVVTMMASDTSTVSATANAISFAAAIGLGGAGAISLSKAVNTIDDDVEAYATQAKIVTTGTGAGLVIHATENAMVTSESAASASAFSVFFSEGIAGATSNATITTTTRAYADLVELNIGGDVDIAAVMTGQANATTTGASYTVAFAGDGEVKTDATATVTPFVESYLTGYADGRLAKAGGDISVGSTLGASANALTEGSSTSISLGYAHAAPKATAKIAPQPAGETPVTTVSSSIRGGNIVSTNGDIIVKSVYNQDLTVEETFEVFGTGAAATAHSSSGSFVATGGANATAEETPYLDSWVASGATLSAGNAVAVISSSLTTPVADAAGKSGGFVGIGESHATATGSPIVDARMDGTIGSAADPGAASLEVRALGVDKAKSTAQAVSKGLGAGSNNESTSTVSPTLDAHIGDNSRIYVSGNITVEARENPEADATTKGVAKGLGGVGGSMSTVNVTPDVTAYIGSGSLIEAGSVNVSAIAKPAIQPGQPDYHIEAVGDAEDTLTVSNHNLQTGDVIEYKTDTTEIGGLDQTYTDAEGETSARQYSVIYVDDDTIALGAGFTVDPNAIDFGVVNPDYETITFATPHNFLNGDQVVYHASDPNKPIGGLTDGGVYTVRVIDANSIQLVAPGASLNSFIVSNVQPDGKTIVDPNNFVNGQAVTYIAPKTLPFASSQVDADVTLGDKPEVTDNPGANNIVFFEEVIDSNGNSSLVGIDHHFTNGDYVVYHVSSMIGEPTVIGGLNNDTVYRVINKTEHTIKLAPTVTGAITFVPQANGNKAYMSGQPWSAYGFAPGQSIRIGGAGANNGDYVIDSIVDGTLYITGNFGTAAIISGKTVDGKTPIELIPNKTDGSMHSVVLARNAPIHGLVSGQTYYIINVTKSSYQLASTPGGAAITLGTTGLNGSTTHWVGTQSIDLGETESGTTHQFRINLTTVTLPDGTTTTLPGGTLPDGTTHHWITGQGGVDLAELVAPPGDTVSTANSKGSGGGVYGESKNESNSNADATVTAYIASGSLRVTGDISVLAASETNARANTTNSTGGFVGIGRSWATTDQTSTTYAYIAAGTNIISGGDVTIDAWSNHITSGTATAKAGGAGVDVRAYMTSELSYDTQAYLEGGAKIAAAGHVGITSDASVDALIHSYADGRGFGGGGYAETDMDILAGSQSLVTLGEGAVVIASTAALRATTSNMDVHADAEGYGAGFVGVSDDFAKVDIYAENKVLLESGSSLTGYRGVDLEATFNNVDTYAYSYGRVMGLFGWVDSDGNNTTTLTSSVVADGPNAATGAPRAQVTTGPRVSDGTIFDEVDALTPGMKIAIASGALAGNVYEYICVLQTDSDPDVDGNQKFDLSLQAYEDADQWKQVEVTSSEDSEGAGTMVNALAPGMTVRVSSGNVYEYIGVLQTDSDLFDLSLQNYSDPGLWKPVAILRDHLADNVVGDATDPATLDQLALYVNTTNYNVKIAADAKVKKKAIAAGHADTELNDNQDRKIVWSADVRISSGQGAVLEINDKGEIVKAINVSVWTSDENPSQTSGQILSNEIFVNDIGNGGSGQVYFNDAWVDGDTVGISGAGSTWDLSGTLGQVLITNYWNRPLKINNINMVNTTGNPLVDLNSKYVSLTFALSRTGGPALVQIINEANSDIILNGTINNPSGSTVIHNSLGNITAARGRDQPEGGVLDGRISLIRTAILDIRAPAAGIGSSAPRVNVDMIYPGLPATTFSANEVCGAEDALFLSSSSLFTRQLVRYTTDGTPIEGLVNGNYYTVIRSADGSTIQLATLSGDVIPLNLSASNAAAVHQLTPAQHVVGVANGDIYLDLKAVLRSMTAVTGFTATVDSLTAGGTINLLLQDAEQEIGAGEGAGVRVTTLQEAVTPNPPGVKDRTFLNFFRPDSNGGATGGVTDTPVNCIYDFRDLNLETSDLDLETGGNLNLPIDNRTAAGLIAGGNIIIEDMDGATVGGVAGLTPTTIAVRARTDLLGTGGHIDVNVDNWVVLTETTGDLLVGLVQSRGGDVALTASDASILDALNDLASDVTGVRITLKAPGGIGTFMNRLEFNWSVPTTALLRATVDGVSWITFRYHGTIGAILDAGLIHLRYVGAPGIVE